MNLLSSTHHACSCVGPPPVARTNVGMERWSLSSVARRHRLPAVAIVRTSLGMALGVTPLGCATAAAGRARPAASRLRDSLPTLADRALAVHHSGRPRNRRHSGRTLVDTKRPEGTASDLGDRSPAAGTEPLMQRLIRYRFPFGRPLSPPAIQTQYHYPRDWTKARLSTRRHDELDPKAESATPRRDHCSLRRCALTRRARCVPFSTWLTRGHASCAMPRRSRPHPPGPRSVARRERIRRDAPPTRARVHAPGELGQPDRSRAEAHPRLGRSRRRGISG